MAIGIFPFAVVVAAALAALLVATAVRLGRQARREQRLSRGRLALFAACAIALWAGTSFFFMLLAALGHSSHPVADSWPYSLVALAVFVALPAAGLLVQIRWSRPNGRARL